MMYCGCLYEIGLGVRTEKWKQGLACGGGGSSLALTRGPPLEGGSERKIGV